ncbi:SagB-type dehydrogenase domain [Kocuria rosea]|uniref:KocE n=1 Tax=Kocuria rosea TaxID=1275 RepID=A0A291FGK0_KOCRO|nr:KocE [Kocuria rosea]STX04160.1 SagB-type dehydrogenase domain [Kocuria rosea]STX07558.1 SagB-type dehydrogenase domain [Kocuria rosea]VEH41722.1 SagB-type dehydrogenase domain [Kocuria rosea]
MPDLAARPAPPTTRRHTDSWVRLALTPGVYLANGAQGAALIRWPRSITLAGCNDATVEVLKELQHPEGIGIDADVLIGEIPASGPRESLLLQLMNDGWLVLSVHGENGTLFAVHPRRRPPAWPDFPEAEYGLSRHTVLAPAGSAWSLEAPHSWCDLRFPDLDTVHRCTAAPAQPTTALARRVLAWCGVLVDPQQEADQLKHRQWATHELWFHERSRRYGRERSFGGTFWARGTFPPPPLRAPTSNMATELFEAVDPRVLRSQSMSLHEVMENRRSLRRHNDSTPLTRAQLGEFLYRTARLRLAQEVDGVEYGSKPYPSGGSVYETEIYLLVRHVSGLAAGLWRYDAQHHGLAPVREGLRDQHVAALLQEATHSSTVDSPPQVTVLMAPAFGRILWKYEQMGYAVMLKHVGVLMQTMYLVATDMGLAACAIGSGDSDLFAQATGLDPLECTTVGEFLLGTAHPAEMFQERPA